MRSFKRARATFAVAALVTGSLLGGPAIVTGAGDGAQVEYVVLAESGASAADVVRAITAAGGTVTSRNAAIGTFEVTAAASGFVEAVSASGAVFGAAGQRAIGQLPDAAPVKVADPEVEAIHEGGPGGPRHGGSTAGMDPLDPLAWGLAMVRSDLARAVNAGDNRVLVGILDSGIDGAHPDLAGQLETALSRNFTTDIPAVDGVCEFARASIRPTGTTAVTGPTSPARSRRRLTASAFPASPRASGSSASAAARTAATCSSVR